MMKLNFDVIVIGSGVAGMTAAIYLKRAGLNCCLLEKATPGGQIVKSQKVENYPGFDQISGAELSNKILNQTKLNKVQYKYGECLEIIDNKDYKIVKTNVEELTCKAIIIATGRKPRQLEVDNSEKLIGKGLSYCATCDGNFFKEKNAVVVGGSDTALTEALYLSNICNQITILVRKDYLRAKESLQKQVKKCKNVHISYNTTIKKFHQDAEGKLDSITIIKNDKEEQLKAKGCFICIGYIPDTKNFNHLIEVDNEGYIKVNPGNRTNINKIYAAGDLIKKDAYQLLTAMSDAVLAADSCIKDLQEID